MLIGYVADAGTRRRLNELADLQAARARRLHGSAFIGDGAAALRSAAEVLERRIVLRCDAPYAA